MTKSSRFPSFPVFPSRNCISILQIFPRKWFWEFYSHGQFIYEKINKATKTLFSLTSEMEPSKRSVVFKAICDLAKECQPDLILVEVVPISVSLVDTSVGRSFFFHV